MDTPLTRGSQHPSWTDEGRLSLHRPTDLPAQRRAPSSPSRQEHLCYTSVALESWRTRCSFRRKRRSRLTGSPHLLTGGHKSQRFSSAIGGSANRSCPVLDVQGDRGTNRVSFPALVRSMAETSRIVISAPSSPASETCAAMVVRNASRSMSPDVRTATAAPRGV
jgi:hypothetical protein